MSLLDEFCYTEVDGVPVVWAPGPAPLAASLAFRVGRADEPFLDGGITHLVEHLVMRGVGRMPIETNAQVGPHFTSFEASGSPGHVVEFLARVCRQLDHVDTSALEVERRVLSAEAESGGGGGPAAEAASLRHGCRGAGLLVYRELGVRRVTAEAIHSWAGRWFTRGNAVLALTGPVPDGLRLPLPPGERAPLLAPPARALDLPAWDTQCGGTAVSMPLAAGQGLDLAVGRLLARAAEERIRHEQGLAYDVDNDGVQVDTSTSEVAVYADNDPQHAHQVASLLLDVVDGFAQAGPAADELEADRAEALEALSDPRSVELAVGAAALDMLAGVQPQTPARLYESTRSRTARDVQEAVRAALPALLVLLPGETGLDRPGLQQLAPSGHPVPTGRELRPRMFKGVPRGARLVVGEAGVALRLADGDLVALWDDIVGVTISADGTHVFQTADGPAIPVVPGDFKGGDEVVARARLRLPESLFVPDPDDEVEQAS